jgi:metallo-beta-lactamase family protein
VAIFEATYGENNRSFTKKEAEQEAKALKDKISEVTKRGNRVLIPSFAYDRSQSIMTFLYENFKDDKDFKDVKVIVDSRLLNEINNVYRNILQGDKLDKWNEVMGWKNFVFVSEYKKTEILAKDKNVPCVIISSSGMLTAGHVLTYAKSILPCKKDCVCFVGYNSPMTIGGKIQQGAKSVTIDNQSVPIRCEINIFRTFTGHAQQQELISYMKSMHCDKILLHHGSENAKDNLKFKAEEEFLFSDITKKVTIIDKKNNQFII